MALDPSIRYEDALSLEQASLTTRGRDNHLGTKELILQYNKVTNQSKEDMMEWLEQNRLTLTDPEFAFRTYEGTWHCVSIEYVEKGPFIQQRFKIDSSLLNDVAQRTQAGTAWKDYYWRIVDPRDYNIPEWTTTGATTPLDLDGVLWYDTHNDEGGETVYEGAGLSLWYTGSLWVITDGGVGEALPSNYYSSATLEGNYAPAGSWAGTPTVGFDSNIQWSKTANDNGDGTYDVTITRSEVVNQTGGSESRSWGETGDNSTEPSYSIWVTGALECELNQEYAPVYDLYGPSKGGAWLDRVWYDTGALNDGEPVYNSNDDSFALWYDSSAEKWFRTVEDQVGINPPAGDYMTADCLYDTYDVIQGSSADKFEVVSIYSVDRNGAFQFTTSTTGNYQIWRGVDNSSYSIEYDPTDGFELKDSSTTYYSREAANLNSAAWNRKEASGSEVAVPYYDPDFVIQIGRNPPMYTSSSQVFTSREEASFVSDGGSILDPVEGEDKQISNVPLDNGQFRVTITSSKANRYRLPALFDYIVYANNGNYDNTAFAVGKNATYAEFQREINQLAFQKVDLQNSVSVTPKPNGLYDYTVRSVEI